MKRIFISGGMSGLPDFNYPAFNSAAVKLRKLGYEVESPHENPQQNSWSEYMRLSIRQMLTCDTIAVLPNWSLSKGAKMEVDIAMKCGLDFKYVGHITEKYHD